MEVDPQYGQSAEALRDVYVTVPTATNVKRGTQVPLLSFASYQLKNTPLAVNHQVNLQRPPFPSILHPRPPFPMRRWLLAR